MREFIGDGDVNAALRFLNKKKMQWDGYSAR
jgi:hypothetical protein